MTLQVWEILKNCQNAKSDDRRVQILKENEVMGVADTLRIFYDTRLVILLPPTPPPYTTAGNTAPAPSNLHQKIQSGILRNFFKGISPQMPQAKREQMFIQLLESLCPEEAELAIGWLTKSLPRKYSKVTEAIVREAYPKLLQPLPVATVQHEPQFPPRLDSEV